MFLVAPSSLCDAGEGARQCATKLSCHFMLLPICDGVGSVGPTPILSLPKRRAVKWPGSRILSRRLILLRSSPCSGISEFLASLVPLERTHRIRKEMLGRDQRTDVIVPTAWCSRARACRGQRSPYAGQQCHLPPDGTIVSKAASAVWEGTQGTREEDPSCPQSLAALVRDVRSVNSDHYSETPPRPASERW